MPPVGTPDAAKRGRSIRLATERPPRMTGDSRLWGRMQAEYHLMVVLLLVAWAVFRRSG